MRRATNTDDQRRSIIASTAAAHGHNLGPWAGTWVRCLRCISSATVRAASNGHVVYLGLNQPCAQQHTRA